MTPITVEQYFGRYIDHPDATPERKANAVKMLAKVNAVRELARADGVEMPDHQHTGSAIAGRPDGVGGQGNGGFRPQSCAVGEPHSTHKEGHGVDSFDPLRAFASWCSRNTNELRRRGLYAENFRWTPTWVHLQDVSPKSGKTVYIPNENPPLAEALPEQEYGHVSA